MTSQEQRQIDRLNSLETNPQILATATTYVLGCGMGADEALASARMEAAGATATQGTEQQTQ